MIRNLALAAAAAASLAACATSTPYQPADRGGYGFSEQRIEDNSFRITFRGNSLTTRETVENSLLYRAAELTLQNGYDHFVVVENETEATRSYSSSASPAFYGHYYYGHPSYYYAFPYYAYGFGWGGPYDTYTREYTRYSAVAFVTMHKGAKPADNPHAFDARGVVKNLRDVVLGTPTSS